MAEKKPAVRGETNFLDPLRGMPVFGYDGNNTTVESLLGASEDLTLRRYYFADIDNTNTWTSGIQAIISWAVQPIGSGIPRADLTDRATGTFTFTSLSGDVKLYLFVWSRG